MSDCNKCCICFVNNTQDLEEETERLQYTCTHAPCMCSGCRKESATWNPICPICRANITILPPLPPVKLQKKYRQLCENYSYVPRQRELQILGRIEEMVEQHNDIYVHYAYMPAPLHVVRLSKTDVDDITLSFYEDYECVLIQNNGAYYHRCQETNDSFDFWAHSVINIHTTLPIWRGMPSRVLDF